MSRGRPEIWIVNEVAVIETGPDSADVITEARQGPQGPKGDTGDEGPNAISGSTSTTFNGLLMGNGSAVSVIAIPGGTTVFLRGDGTFASPTATDVGADPSGTATAAMVAHIGAGDPHSQYGLKSGKLNQFAATSSGELAGVLSDETGTGVVVYSTSPTITTPVVSGTLVVRQPAGTPGVDQVEISHSGNGLVQSKGGEIRLADANGYGIRIYKNGTLVEVDPLNSSTNQLVLGNNTGSTVTCGYWRSNGGTGNWEATGTGYKVTWNGDTAIGRAAARVVGLSNTSTAGATLSSPPLSPSQITADQNNYSPGVARNYRLTSDASRIITGLSVGQVDGLECRVRNSGSNNIVIAHQSASSTAANRFRCETGVDITIPPGGRVELVYDATDSRWDVYPSKTCT